MALVDSHAHLDMLEDLDDVMVRSREAGIGAVVTIGVDRASSRWAVRTARARRDVWGTVGLHPHDAKDWTPSLGEELAALAGEERIVGIGEAGLDYYYDHSPRETQREVFAWHVDLARRAGKTLVIHCRDAFDDTFDTLEQNPPRRIVFHCWSGGPAEAERALALGAVLSFAGTVTFKNAEPLREAARAVPLDRMLVETDAPFLTPVPFRGKRNEPAYVATTAAFLAELKGVAFDDLAAVTSATASGLFGFPIPG